MKFTAIAAIQALSVPLCLHFTVTLFSPAIFTVCFGGFPLHAPPAYHRQLCQVFLSAPILVTESNRAGSLMSSGLPSARVADTGSRVAEWDYESGAFGEDRRHRESRLQRGWGVAIVLAGGGCYGVGGCLFWGSKGYRGCGRRGSRRHPGSSLFRGAVRRADQYKQTPHMRRRLTIGRH